MTTIVTTAPPVEPVTLAEAKLWARIDADDTSQDDVVTLLIAAMRSYAENYTGRAFVPRQLRKILPWFAHPIRLQYPPLISVDSITYLDLNGDEQTLSSSLYDVQTWATPGYVGIARNAVWPSTGPYDDAVKVNYTAGYAPPSGSPTDYQANVPEALKVWVQARITTLYDQRGHLMLNNTVKVPHDFADGVLDPLVTAARVA